MGGTSSRPAARLGRVDCLRLREVSGDENCPPPVTKGDSGSSGAGAGGRAAARRRPGARGAAVARVGSSSAASRRPGQGARSRERPRILSVACAPTPEKPLRRGSVLLGAVPVEEQEVEAQG